MLLSERRTHKIWEISKAVSNAQNTKYKGDNAIVLEHPDVEKETKIPSDSSELIVITKAKKLTAYVITITEKSPKKFRAVFINRMQNYSLDCIENLIEANSIRMDSVKNKERRRECQRIAFLKLKLYIAILIARYFLKFYKMLCYFYFFFIIFFWCLKFQYFSRILIYPFFYSFYIFLL